MKIWQALREQALLGRSTEQKKTMQWFEGRKYADTANRNLIRIGLGMFAIIGGVSLLAN